VLNLILRKAGRGGAHSPDDNAIFFPLISLGQNTGDQR